jgi:hypothetical protein
MWVMLQGQKISFNKCSTSHSEPQRLYGKEVTVRMRSGLLDSKAILRCGITQDQKEAAEHLSLPSIKEKEKNFALT